jgi:hypothetical protein
MYVRPPLNSRPHEYVGKCHTSIAVDVAAFLRDLCRAGGIIADAA